VIVLRLVTHNDYIVGIYSFALRFAEGFYQLQVVIRRNINPMIAQYIAKKDFLYITKLKKNLMKILSKLHRKYSNYMEIKERKMWTVEKLATEFGATTIILINILEKKTKAVEQRDVLKRQLTSKIALAQSNGKVEGSNQAKRDAWLHHRYAEDYDLIAEMEAEIKVITSLETVASLQLSNLQNQFQYLELKQRIREYEGRQISQR